MCEWMVKAIFDRFAATIVLASWLSRNRHRVSTVVGHPIKLETWRAGANFVKAQWSSVCIRITLSSCIWKHIDLCLLLFPPYYQLDCFFWYTKIGAKMVLTEYTYVFVIGTGFALLEAFNNGASKSQFLGSVLRVMADVN